MNRKDAAIRNAEMCRRRAEGALLHVLAADHGVSVPSAGRIVRDVVVPRSHEPEARPAEPIQLDDATRAEIEAATREASRCPPFKSSRAWPA